MASSLAKLRGNKARARERATLGREVDVNNDRVRQRSFNNSRHGASEGMKRARARALLAVEKTHFRKGTEMDGVVTFTERSLFGKEDPACISSPAAETFAGSATFFLRLCETEIVWRVCSGSAARRKRILARARKRARTQLTVCGT